MLQPNTLCNTVARAVACGKPELLLPLAADTVTVRTNFAGNSQSASALSLLACPAAQWPLRKLNLEALLTGEGRAAFDVIALHAVGNTAQRFHFVQYGLRFALQFQNDRITAIAVDLRWMDGNTRLLEPWLPFPCCIGPTDGVKPGASDGPSDTVLQFAWDLGLDGKCPQSLLPDAQIDDRFHGVKADSAATWWSAVENSPDRACFLNHTLRIIDVQQDDATAHVLAHRMQPDRIGSRAISMDSYYMDWFTMDEDFSLKRQDGRWRITALTITPKLTQLPALDNLIG